MGMIKIFTAEATDFSSNGDVVIQPVKAKVHKEDNGDFYLDIEAPLDYQSYFVGGNIIVAPTPQGDQAFRLLQVTKTRKKITAKAWHIWYDCKNIAIYYPYDATWSRLDWMTRVATDDDYVAPVPQLTGLNQSDDTTARYQASFRCSLYEFFEQILAALGGHYIRDNWSFCIKSSIGQDKGITIEYGKNLKEITKVEDWTDVCTVILPVGKDGTRLSTWPQITSNIRASSAQYDAPYAKVVTFDQADVAPADLQTDLRNKADAYLALHHLPKISYSLKASLDLISDIGDTIRVKDTVLGVDVMTKVFSYDYDCLTDRYTEVTFGNFTPTAKGMANTVNGLAKNAQLGIIGGEKMLQFNSDNTVTWASMNPTV